jgi:hypothetical protein
MFDSNLRVPNKLIGRFFNALLVNQHDSGHHHRLRFRARLGQTSFDEEFVDTFASHTGDITLERGELSPAVVNVQAYPSGLSIRPDDARLG